MSLLKFLKEDKNARKIFGKRELKIIEKQPGPFVRFVSYTCESLFVYYLYAILVMVLFVLYEEG